MFNLHYRLSARHRLSASPSSALPASAVRSRSTVVHDHQTVEDAPDMRVYTPARDRRPQYLHPGRRYACHSQMIRTLRDEVERYGPYSLAVESKYDHPMLWGSKKADRAGPRAHG